MFKNFSAESPLDPSNNPPPLQSGSLYNEGMKPLFYSDQNAKNKNLGWIRMGHNIHYYKNNVRRKDCKGERYVAVLIFKTLAVRERGEFDFDHHFAFLTIFLKR